MRELVRKALATLSLLSFAAAGWAEAAPPASVPEPGVLELAALGAAVAFAVSLRKRRR